MNGNQNQNDLELILDDIQGRPELATFFNRLEDDSSFRRLFLLHPHDLFGISDDFILPVLFSVSNIDEDESQVLSLMSDLTLARFQKAYQMFPFNPMKLPRELLDLIMYALFTYVRENDDIKNLITGDLSLSKMEKVLGEYNEIWDELGRIINETEDPTLIQLKKRIEVFAKDWVKQFEFKPLEFLESLVNLLPNLYSSIHNSASSHVGSVLKKSKLNQDNYNQVLSHLYALRFIVRQDSVFRCDRCIDQLAS